MLPILLTFMLASAAPKRLLIFGGNGFIGSSTVHKLIQSKYDIHLLNRGSWPFDTEKTIKPFVKSHFCDRKHPEQCLSELKQELEGLEFDAVLDFSAYKAKFVEPFYGWIGNVVKGPYIYISTDSVYEVSQLTSPPISETAARRPIDATERDRLNRADSYGHNKFEVEEFLSKKAATGGLPFIFLRLADVLGPRDSTDRFWKYQLWLTHALPHIPLAIPPHLHKLRTSYVYVNDIATVIGNIFAMESEQRFALYNEAFNIALESLLTLEELLRAMAKPLGIKPVFSGSGLVDYFPSVTRGFLDISKAKRMLGFQPTTLEEVMKQSTDFYVGAFKDFPEKRDENWQELLDDLEPAGKELVDAAERSFTKAMASEAREEL